MADNSAKIANMARNLSIAHIIVGFLLFSFGIADLFMMYSVWRVWTPGYGIWMGAWMCIAGRLGIPGTRKEPSPSRNCFAGVFMGFSITSAVFGGIIIINYGLIFAYFGWYNKGMAISAIVLILGIVAFVIGIWAAVCLCLMKPCCNQPQQGHIGYVMTQGPDGVPVAVPIQAGGGMIAVQSVSPGAQEGQPQMVMVPVSGAMTTGYQPQQAEMPPSYGHGQYMKLENEQE